MKIIASFIVIIAGFLFNFKGTKKAKASPLTRQTIDTIAYAKGIIRQMGNDDVFMIECAEKHIKLNVLNLPNEYKEIDLPIVFSGNIKLTHPLEDEDGQYFEVTTIH